MAEFSFPTETIDLPSEGKLYPEGSPLRNGKLDIKYMTAKEEDILTSTNLLKRGVVIDRLMESLIVTPGVKPDDLLIGDLNAAMVASRILAYGKDYPVDLNCRSCNTTFNHSVDLSELNPYTPQVSPNDDGEYSCTLPTGVYVTFKLLTRAEEKQIEADVNALKKLDKSVESDGIMRLRHIIKSVNGKRDVKVIREFSEAILIRDLRAFREEYSKVCPDIKFEVNIEYPECGSISTMRVPLGANFFWPDLRL